MGSTEQALVCESAIADHLRRPRTVQIRMPEPHTPAFPAFTSRFTESVKDIVLAIIGAQHANAEKAKEADALSKILSFMEKGPESSPPRVRDLASVTDNTGAYNEVVLAYWDNIPAFEDWKEASGFAAWWNGLDPTAEPHGWFQEVLLPSVDRYESIYAALPEDWTPEGAGAFASNMSAPVKEHGYWGSMRDRLPLSQVDEMVGEKKASSAAVPQDTTKARIRVPGKENLAIIRSGQDWSQASAEESKLYTDTLHPVLTDGMHFLRDEGAAIGCYSCRFMDVLHPSTKELGTKQTFGLAYFDDLASLEKWSKEHPTHLKIFGRFFQYVKSLNFDITLRLYHEVVVLKPEQQYFEYIGCHAKTGMLTGLKPGS